MADELPPRAVETIVYLSKLAERSLYVMPFLDPRLTALMTGIVAPGLSYNTWKMRENSQFEGNEKAKCLVAQSPAMEYLSIMGGVKGQVAGFFTEQGVSVDFKHSATRKDLVDALKDPDYQHIAVMGHGDGNCWEAKDGIVTADDLDYIMDRHDIPKKTGYFLQMTCGLLNKDPLGRAVVETPDKVLGYTRPQGVEEQLRNLFKKNIGLENLLYNRGK